MTTKEHILAQCARYPELEPRDLLKFLHQSVFGPGHLVKDDAGGLDFLRAETTACRDVQDLEPLDGAFFRAHPGLLNSGLTSETLWRCFCLSSQVPAGTAADLEARLSAAADLAWEGKLPFSYEEFSAAVSDWRAAGFPAQHHSGAFRAAYTPAYRVLHRDYAWMLPLLTAIDRKMAAGKPILVALEGGSASGKTTLGEKLRGIYDCPVLHMDDFFLQPHQRTAHRFSIPGGNVDHERFLTEVLLPCRRGETVHYQPWDCHTQSLCPTADIPPAPLTIVEGAYSCHPALREHYDLTVYLSISPALQHRRIEKRNTPEFQQRFFQTWIPLEQGYFDAFDIPGHCDIRLEADT